MAAPDSLAPTLETLAPPLLAQTLSPANWVVSGSSASVGRPTWKLAGLLVRAAVEVLPTLETQLHIALKGPMLSLFDATESFEAFLKSRIPFLPNSEWRVEIDSKKWVHLRRRYTSAPLRA